MNFVESTLKYESWLAKVVAAPLESADLDYKHQVLADPSDPFPFFRGTYYRWAQHWAEIAGPLDKSPRVTAIGDLHIENFGTRRDADGRLCWGVNDFDEVDELPYTNDLVRLAASIRFARKASVLEIKLGEGCDAILEGYRECMKTGGKPFVLEEHHPHLRAVAMAADREPAKFWEKLSKVLKDPAAKLPDDARSALASVLPTDAEDVQYRNRLRAGVGSLGRARYIALAQWKGGAICREAKAAAPPATIWANGNKSPVESLATESVAKSKRSHDPFYQPGKHWVVRRLGPRSCRIELEHMNAADAGRLLHAMGAETANVHLASPKAATAALADLDSRKPGWMADAAKAICDVLEADWTEWKSHWSAVHPVPAGRPDGLPGE